MGILLPTVGGKAGGKTSGYSRLLLTKNTVIQTERGTKVLSTFFLYQNKLILIFHFTLYFFEVPLFTQERNVWCDYWNLQSQQAKRALGSRSVLACSSVTMACIDPDSKCIQPLVWNVVSCKNKLAFYFPEKGGVAAQ